MGVAPYFDEPFYVGFSVAGYELGVDPNADRATGSNTYWGVTDIDGALADLLGAGALPRTLVRDVGSGIRVATAREPGGAVLGIIFNPHLYHRRGHGDRSADVRPVTAPSPWITTTRSMLSRCSGS